MAGRPQGTKNPDYESNRCELVSKLKRCCLATPHVKLRLRDMAAGCGVSVPTLKHYFADRQRIVRAILEQSHIDGRRFIDETRKPQGTLNKWIVGEIEKFFHAFHNFGLDRLNSWGITEGLTTAESGPDYLQFFLEPALQSLEKGLEHYQSQGQFSQKINCRFAALSLLAPCILLEMHQNSLGESKVRPADISEFIHQHSNQFLGYLRSSDQ